MRVLAVDTSAYTTSAAFYDGVSHRFENLKTPLFVKEGERGLRQSDSVFLHNKNLPPLIEKLFAQYPAPECVCVSTAPRPQRGSYMPCFSVGEGYARALAAAMKLRFCSFSHQEGHIGAILLGSGRADFLEKENFHALHVSGGTTEILRCERSGKGFAIEILGRTLDISAGQLIDRVGVRLGFGFPAGAEVSRAAELFSGEKLKAADCAKRGYCNFSGIENKACELISRGRDAGEICAFVLDTISATICSMMSACGITGAEETVLSGGVMSSDYIKSRISERFRVVSADAPLCSDNACGLAYLAGELYGE